ncbi:hypothetical protein FRB95_004301 [Tulasnella sp. JGI-2019a]|nr:hypothetical protein FRB95_004301 [Tulasnella sp. JGI-2019a]
MASLFDIDTAMTRIQTTVTQYNMIPQGLDELSAKDSSSGPRLEVPDRQVAILHIEINHPNNPLFRQFDLTLCHFLANAGAAKGLCQCNINSKDVVFDHGMVLINIFFQIRNFPQTTHYSSRLPSSSLCAFHLSCEELAPC